MLISFARTDSIREEEFILLPVSDLLKGRGIDLADKRVQVGDVAPDFTLKSQTGQDVRLSDFRGKRPVVLYFYPKDFTTGCTSEACAFRDSFESFKELGRRSSE